MSNETAEATLLFKAGLIPLYTCLTSLTWVLHDYLLTVEAEALYIWPGPWTIGKIIFFYVRYYTILLVLFDVAQIHSFSTFYPSLHVCVAMDSVIRVVGALSLWAIEIVMQLRIYALYGCSKRVAQFNAVLFLASIGGFLYVLVHNAQRRAAVIEFAKTLPIPGCPSVHTGIEWLQWVPATVFEGVLFAFVLFKSCRTLLGHFRESPGRRRHSLLVQVLVTDNLLYFFGAAGVLIFNNLMVVGKTRIPWFSYAPFHAGLGIMTGRLLLHLRKTVWIAEMGSSDTSSETEMDETTTSWGVPGHSPRVVSDDSVFDTSFSDSR